MLTCIVMLLPAVLSSLVKGHGLRDLQMCLHSSRRWQRHFSAKKLYHGNAQLFRSPRTSPVCTAFPEYELKCFVCLVKCISVFSLTQRLLYKI